MEQTDQTDARILAKCRQCGQPSLASVKEGALRPINNKPGNRCPNCGGDQFTEHPLIESPTQD
jgi:DNA-directed RNA polymerase subunit RPC12/RpoP